MKTIIHFLLLLLLASSVKSQVTTEAFKYKAFKAAFYSNDLQKGYEWVDVNILVVYSFADTHLNKVSVYAKKNIKIDIVDFIKDYNDDNNIFWSKYTGVDGDGEEYTIELGHHSDVNENHVGTLRMYNQKGLGFIYYLKLNE